MKEIVKDIIGGACVFGSILLLYIIGYCVM